MNRRHVTLAGAIAAGALALAAVCAAGWAGVALAADQAAAVSAVSQADASADRGRAIYQGKCVECHGASGRGDGPAAVLMTPRPRDFTSGKYEIRSTETGSVPTDDDLVRTVAQGMPGTAMPAWKTLLTDAQIRDVVEYVKSFSPQFATGIPKAVATGPDVTASPEGLARGKAVFDKLQCAGCHGTDGRGKDAIATDFEDDWGQPLLAADLTAPWTFHGGASPRDIYLRFRTGMSGTPMPSFADTASDAEMWDLANYVASLARKPVWSMSADEVKAFYAQEDAAAKADPVTRGRYLVETMGCALCHSPMDEEKRVLPGMKLAGGTRIRIEPFGDYPTGNLTSDKETGLGSWTDAEIERVITKGTLRDGTRLLPFPMDWPSFSTLAPDDLNAIVAYLRTVPPVYNKVPPPSRPVLPIYLWGKFRMLVLQQDLPIVFFPGNAGATKGGR